MKKAFFDIIIRSRINYYFYDYPKTNQFQRTIPGLSKGKSHPSKTIDGIENSHGWWIGRFHHFRQEGILQ